MLLMAEGVRLTGIGRNQYIDLMNTLRSKVRRILPSDLVKYLPIWYVSLILHLADVASEEALDGFEGDPSREACAARHRVLVAGASRLRQR
jgi:hypothetical protein